MASGETLPSKSARKFGNDRAHTSARPAAIRATIWGMRVELLTREYPPHIYGGAGVHVDELARVLRGNIEVGVACLDGPRTEVGGMGYATRAERPESNPEAGSPR